MQEGHTIASSHAHGTFWSCSSVLYVLPVMTETSKMLGHFFVSPIFVLFFPFFLFWKQVYFSLKLLHFFAHFLMSIPIVLAIFLQETGNDNYCLTDLFKKMARNTQVSWTVTITGSCIDAMCSYSKEVNTGL